jgi:Tetracyclin repressor-like, C-terminal domain
MATLPREGRRALTRPWTPVWERPVPPPDPRWPAATPAGIVAAAGAVADAAGLDSVDPVSVGLRLGVPDSAVTPYAAGHDDLLDLMIDAGFAAVGLPGQPTADWQADLRAAADGLWASCQQRPWLAPATFARPLASPHALDYYEFCLGTLDRAGLELPVAINVVFLLQTYVINCGLGLREHNAMASRYAGVSAEELHEFIVPALNRATNTGRHPTYARWLRDCGVHYDLDQLYRYGLDCLLADAAATVAGRGHRAASGEDA